MGEWLRAVEVEGNLCGSPMGKARSGVVASADAPEVTPWGPTAGDPVDLSIGVEDYQPSPDLSVYCDHSEPVEFQRNWRNDVVVAQYGTPGLAKGWTHNWDVTLQEDGGDGPWKSLELVYPNGSSQLLTPVLDGQGQPTGTFTVEDDAGYFAQGVPSSTAGRWESVTLTFRDQATWRFTWHEGDAVYVLARRANMLDKAVTLAYDEQRRLLTLTDEVSDEVLATLVYDTAGYLAQVVDRFGRQVAYTHAVLTGEGYSGDRTALTEVSQIAPFDESQPAARYTYGYAEVEALPVGEGGGLRGSEDDSLLLLTTVEVPSPTGEGVSTASLAYYAGSYRLASVTDGNGVRRDYLYLDGNTQVTVSDADGALLQNFAKSFDANGSETGSTQPGAPIYEYDDPAWPRKITKITYADGRYETYSYDSHGNEVSHRDQRGTVTATTYDYSTVAFGRATQVTRTPNGGTARVMAAYTYYEPSGLVQTVTSPQPGTTDGSTVTTTYTYDALGNVYSVTTPGNNAAATLTTTFEYEVDGDYHQTRKLGQPLRMNCPGTCARHYRYDARGNQTTYTDALGNTWTTEFNLSDQAISAAQPATGQSGAGHNTSASEFLYPGGPLMGTTVLDEGGSVVQHIDYGYGQEGERLSVSGGTEPVEYRYDALYRLIRQIDGNGHATRYDYDGDGRLALTRYPLGTADSGFDTLRNTSYDQTGRLLQKVDGRDWVANYAYGEAGGALTNVSYPLHSGQNVTYGHDALGRVTSMTDGTGTITYAYDDLGNQLTVTTTYTNVPSQTVSYAYYPNGQRQTMATPAGTYSYAYDATKHVVSLTSPEGTAAWTWLDNGWLGAQTLPNGAWTEYTYLPNGRLSTLTNKDADGNVLSRYLDLHYRGTGDLDYLVADVPGHAEHTGTTRVSYDHRRQLVREQSTRGSGYDHAYQYDEAGNPVVFKGQARTFNSDNQETTGDGFVYDGNGNPTTYGGQTASYDVANHLTAYSGQTAAYRGDGLRAWKQEGTARTHFVYDRQRSVCAVDAAGNVVDQLTFGAHGLLARGGAELLFDWQGNTVQSLSSGGATTGPIYEAYGSAAGGYKAQHGYLSEVDLGLLLCTHRYLDPSRGRWVTRDPIGYRGGANVYGYVQARPPLLSDVAGTGQMMCRGGGGPSGPPFSHCYVLFDKIPCDGAEGWGFRQGEKCPKSTKSGSACPLSGKGRGPGVICDEVRRGGDWPADKKYHGDIPEGSVDDVALCKCVQSSRKEPHNYDIHGVDEDNCASWACKMMNCAAGRELGPDVQCTGR